MNLKRFTLKSVIISGIYFLIRKGKIVYIGQSANLIGRIMTHYSNDSMKFDTIRFIRFDGHRYTRRNYESRLIKYFKPKWNSVSELKRIEAKRKRKQYYIKKKEERKTSLTKM